MGIIVRATERGGRWVQWPRGPWSLGGSSGGPWVSGGPLEGPLTSWGLSEGPWTPRGPIDMTVTNEFVGHQRPFFLFFWRSRKNSEKIEAFCRESLFFWRTQQNMEKMGTFSISFLVRTKPEVPNIWPDPGPHVWLSAPLIIMKVLWCSYVFTVIYLLLFFSHLLFRNLLRQHCQKLFWRSLPVWEAKRQINKYTHWLYEVVMNKTYSISHTPMGNFL